MSGLGTGYGGPRGWHSQLNYGKLDEANDSDGVQLEDYLSSTLVHEDWELRGCIGSYDRTYFEFIHKIMIM